MKRIYRRIRRMNYTMHELFQRMKRKVEKMDEPPLRPQLAGAC